MDVAEKTMDLSDNTPSVTTPVQNKKQKKKARKAASINKDDSELSDISTASTVKDSKKKKAKPTPKIDRTPSDGAGAESDEGKNKLKDLLIKLRGNKNDSDSDDSDAPVEDDPMDYTLGEPHKLSEKRDMYVRLFAKKSPVEEKLLITITPLVIKNGSLQKEKFAKSVSLRPKEYLSLVSFADNLGKKAVQVRKKERQRFKKSEAASKSKNFFRKRPTGKPNYY